MNGVHRSYLDVTCLFGVRFAVMKILSVAVFLKIQVFWDVTICEWVVVLGLQHSVTSQKTCVFNTHSVFLFGSLLCLVSGRIQKQCSVLYVVDCFQDSVLRVKERFDFSVVWYICRSASFALHLPVVNLNRLSSRHMKYTENTRWQFMEIHLISVLINNIHGFL
jgi:hypothetical protein